MRQVLVVAMLSAATALAAPSADEPAPPRRAIDTAAAWADADTARALAAAERHRESARAFIAALNHDARLVGEICDELAFQKLWNDEHDRAIFYFRRYLARRPGEANRDARRGLALACSWSGRQGQAIQLYRGLVREDSTDLDARFGLGRSLIWDNRLREGHGVLRDLEVGHPGTGPGRDARDFLLVVLDEYEPHLDVRWDGIWDSDELTIHRLTARGRTNLGSVLPEVGAGVAFYSQPGRPSLTAPRLSLGVVAPLAHDWAVHAYGWVDRFTSDGPLAAGDGDLDWTRLGGDAWLTWLASPRLRVDLGAASQVVETYDAFADHLHYEPVTLSADWRFAPRWTLSGAAQSASYSDGNLRRRGSAQLWWRRPGTWEIALGPTAYAMDYEEPYPGGYWAPDWVRNGSLAARIGRRWPRLALAIDGSYGLEKELGSDAIGVGGVHGHLGWRFAPAWLVGADLSHSRSRFTSDSGYNRTAASIRVRVLL
ncbi:MAG TPA: hypothetical protein PLL30_12755 [Candidatus Krumholzibacteria bacterium]|nr:hypothetical protein [Candidatus Krumholzibacteria bacterium]HPD72639.1 hypothetical protein [Candidatus Krumholzibacteria bacterium]HRY40429.1 hypothetical protein [Candidatus Krumholzibacteria bacterium]